MATLGVAEAERGAGARGTPHYQLLLSGAVQVSSGGGGKDAVGAEKGPAREHRPVRCVESVRLLVEGPGENVCAPLEVGHRQGCLHPGRGVLVAGRVGDGGVPQRLTVRPVRRIPSDVRVLRVTGPDENRVQRGATHRGHGWGRVDRRTTVKDRPTLYGRPTRQVVSVQVATPVPDHHGRPRGVEVGDHG